MTQNKKVWRKTQGKVRSFAQLNKEFEMNSLLKEEEIPNKMSDLFGSAFDGEEVVIADMSDADLAEADLKMREIVKKILDDVSRRWNSLPGHPSFADFSIESHYIHCKVTQVASVVYQGEHIRFSSLLKYTYRELQEFMFGRYLSLHKKLMYRLEQQSEKPDLKEWSELKEEVVPKMFKVPAGAGTSDYSIEKINSLKVGVGQIKSSFDPKPYEPLMRQPYHCPICGSDYGCMHPRKEK